MGSTSHSTPQLLDQSNRYSRLRRFMPSLLLFLTALIGTIAVTSGVAAQNVDYERQADVAPGEDDIGGEYVTPKVQNPRPRGYWAELVDVGLLAIALGLAVWFVIHLRNRKLTLGLNIACLAYFGFYREGCVCPIGSIQNVALSLGDPVYAIPIVVTAAFVLPLLVALFFGRAFCGGVCPLGAIQELVVLKPVQVPVKLDRCLGWLKWVYLGLAIWFVLLPAADRDFLICRYDPFVGFFRRSGFAHMMFIGAGFLLLGVFVGRPYCRYLCPYGALLSLCARLSGRGVTITPAKELDCGLCTEACPYGSIENMRAIRKSCLYCARCYAACPVDGPRAKEETIALQQFSGGAELPGAEGTSAT